MPQCDTRTDAIAITRVSDAVLTRDKNRESKFTSSLLQSVIQHYVRRKFIAFSAEFGKISLDNLIDCCA